MFNMAAKSKGITKAILKTTILGKEGRMEETMLVLPVEDKGPEK